MRREGEPSVLCVGPSHKTASLSARERFALVGATAERLTDELHGHPEVLEIVGVATCNRSELYLAVTDSEGVLPVVVAAFANLASAETSELSAMLAVRVDAAAVHHLLRVAAGVESVVVGEAEIQGQLKQALQAARDAGTCGPTLDKLFRTALQTGKRVRSETSIGVGRTSVGSVAAEVLAGRLGDLRQRRALVVGAGEMGALVARSLRERGVTDIVVLNRSPERAVRLADVCDVAVASIDCLEDELVQCDAVVTSTSASEYIITRHLLEHVTVRRDGRPLVLVDAAVPRNVEPTVGTLTGCHLYDLDDLEHAVATSLHVRGGELLAVAEIVDEASAQFLAWRQQQAAVPGIIAMRGAAEQLRQAEFERFDRSHAHLAPEDRRRVELLTRSIVNRLLHVPTVHLRELTRR